MTLGPEAAGQGMTLGTEAAGRCMIPTTSHLLAATPLQLQSGTSTSRGSRTAAGTEQLSSRPGSAADGQRVQKAAQGAPLLTLGARHPPASAAAGAPPRSGTLSAVEECMRRLHAVAAQKKQEELEEEERRRRAAQPLLRETAFDRRKVGADLGLSLALLECAEEAELLEQVQPAQGHPPCQADG